MKERRHLIIRQIRPIGLIRIMSLIGLLLLSLTVQGQVYIGGNVYGGGNKGNVAGSTSVTVKEGNLNKVFGGARQANVGGNAYVNIDGKEANGYMVINYVYGGNDISGNIGTAATVGKALPTELTGNPDGVDNTWNTYVHISSKTLESGETDPTNKKIYIGQLFAGGNGDYSYTDEYGDSLRDEEFNYIVMEGRDTIAKRKEPFNTPVLEKTYLNVRGGSIVYAYGGGNNATVTEKTVIRVENPSDVVNHILVDEAGVEADAATYTAYETSENQVIPTGYTDLLTNDRFKAMGINLGYSKPSSDEFQIGRFFGGNNLAEMHIMPTWKLQRGKIRNLYSGGNRGDMTSPTGLLLEIDPVVPNGLSYEAAQAIKKKLVIDNVYGGCRMADVMPTVNGVYTPCTNLPDPYKFPNELSARVLVRGGDINNVYGGNDITGVVYGGNAIGIYTTVRGNVYGGGNGAYPYTDIKQDDEIYGDLFYNVTTSSIDNLNAFRPNAEQVSIRLKGESAEHPTIIQGSVFIGGNCATLATKKANPLVELKIGSHVLADKVFLGNNGEEMVDTAILARYADDTHSTLQLTGVDAFKEYMEGVAMNLQPDIVFDNTVNGDPDNYIDYTSKIGSFYCGGNVGSMAIEGKNTYDISRGLVIFDKFVAGCNNANVPYRPGLNAAYEGGVLGSQEERENYTDAGGHIKDRIEVNLSNMTIEPRRWNDVFTQVASGTTLTAGKTYYTSNLRSSQFIAKGTEVADNAENTYFELTTVGTELVWDTAKWDTTENEFVAIGTDNTADDADRRLLGGNIYGGCYDSGHVNGNVTININQDLIRRNVVFAEADPEDSYKMKSGGERRSGVLLDEQGDDIMSVAMTVFGAGCGEDTEIWGSTTVNHNNGYCFQIFGGGEEGVVGKKRDVMDAQGHVTGQEYYYDSAYSSTVNLKGPNPGYSEEQSGAALAETEYIYGAGNEGDVCGDSYVYLGNGRIYDAFGGASNADILGAAELYVGYDGGFPWIRDNVYGGNDFGGTIKGKKNHSSVTTRTPFDTSLLESSTYVKYIQGRVDSIFGGNYGDYEYIDRMYKDYTNADGTPVEGFNFPHLNDNSFVHFQPNDNANNKVANIFGGSEGYPGDYDMNNAMQGESYVLVDDINTRVADRYANVDIYGGGAFAGVGAYEAIGAGRTVVDLYAGRFNNIYGGSNQEGLIGYARVNVPAVSTVKVNSLFGGSKGYDPAKIEEDASLTSRYCDTYVTCIDYQGQNAIVEDGIYGGNQNCRIACDTYINIEAPVMQSNGYQATIYGAGYGKETVSGRTNVFMNNGSVAYKVFGGGRDGNAFNFASLRQWLANQYLAGGIAAANIEDKVTEYGGILTTFGTYLASHPINLPTNIGTYVNHESRVYDGTYTNDIITSTQYHQTNVHIMAGSNVTGYAYGGGLGTDAVVGGSTYIELKGGIVDRDIYAGGQGGPVFDEFKLGPSVFTATTNAYIESGMVRNVYGGGYLGHVGKHTKIVNSKEVDADINDSYATDILGEANVVIGKKGGTGFLDGIPAILRNAYGGGEGGSVYGTANMTINNGMIGYRCDNTGTQEAPVYKFTEVTTDQKPNDIELAGNVFGGGYVVNSYVDIANVNMYGGTIRGSLYGGGEVGPIGRGTIRYAGTAPYNTTGLLNQDARIVKAGETHIKMYGGQVLRNVFGGGRGKDSWGGDGTMYMDKNLVATLDLNCKGYVFGQTDVNIYGGEIGTEAGMARNFGNVFGGGDEGSVYSAYMDGNNLRIGKKAGVRYDGNYEGYYFKSDGTNYYEHNVAEEGQPVKMERYFTEDCHVLVEPHCEALSAVTIGNDSYEAGSYVPTSALNKLHDKTTSSAVWDNLNNFGIIIHNAVFAGGNIASGSSSMYANEKTVFGNATATIHDVYNRDLITIGTGHTGGLYGDGNLTFVDGYRELNITNYGTDYYHIAHEILYDNYKDLPEREKAYYEVKYKCKKTCTDIEETNYSAGTNLPQDELMVLFTNHDGTSVMAGSDSIIITVNGKKIPNPDYWEENGVVSTYAGRIMNTIQRADLCGVFGSRMVMKGAQDRVPEEVDYTNYTINRVREVSLNKMDSPAGDNDKDNKLHGNYFGIYSIVNYLGSLTSDVKFDDVRTTNADTIVNKDLKADGVTSFYQWKQAHKDDKKRNNGTCHNHLALASGVYLELTTEKSTGVKLDEKDWGLITGVVELDLINVQPGIGGGFVYAKNEHGAPSSSGAVTTTLTALNEHAATKWDYNYSTIENADNQKQWQTSGNFIHSSQTIVDDCYNIGSRYMGAGKVPAHYWFISGQVYVYDQYISAYAGSPNAYSRTVEIPITINAASHGTMTLMDVQPNLYAYYSSYTSPMSNTKLGTDQKMVINNVTYHLNDPISYWDWNKLAASEKKLFVDSTYVLKDSCKVGDTFYPAGYVMLPEEYDNMCDLAVEVDLTPNDNIDNKVWAVLKATKDANDNDVAVKDKDNNDVYVAFEDMFHSSNNMGHETGYQLVYNMTNPSQWNQWYTEKTSADDNSDGVIAISERTKNRVGGADYEDGPTYHPTQNGLYGQRHYDEASIIPQSIYTAYETLKNGSNSSVIPETGQAVFVPAFVVTKEYTSPSHHLYPGAPVFEKIEGYTDSAYVCTSTIDLSNGEYIYVNELMTKSEKNTLKTKYSTLAADIDKYVVPAYYCTTGGLYGGDYYETDKNYRGLAAWSAMSEADREYFEFNYDVLDLLIDPTYGKIAAGVREKEGKKYQYDSKAKTLAGAESNAAHYSLSTSVDYTASYNSDNNLNLGKGNDIEFKRGNTVMSDSIIMKNDTLSREVYESLPNEQRHYAAIKVNSATTATNVYVVHTGFIHVETPYAAGAAIEKDTYDRMSDAEKANIAILTFPQNAEDKTYYYCREGYTAAAALNGALEITGAESYTTGSTSIPQGIVIDYETYSGLPNKQKNFAIHGVSPMETSTLYVSRNSDINDLSTEKVITVIYKYDYEESDADGMHITPISERHVVNIHITFMSGAPTIEDIQEPSIVLPGTSLTMRVPSITPGAYEVLGGGWELFEKDSYVENHTNGIPYRPTTDSLYWYQDGFLIAYYTKTYLGKTYSNAVPVSVANYHDLKAVMDDKKHHLHVDYDRTRLKRDSKIYINDYSSSSQNGLDLLKDLYDLSLISKETTGITTAGDSITNSGHKLKGHVLLNNSTETGINIFDEQTYTKGIKAGDNLEFILRADINHTDSWTPIAAGENEPCFNGTLHGDGHTISGIEPATGTTGSLFNKLCGSVYNLGVTGSFTGGGVADTGGGYVESCWVKTTGTPDSNVKAVFGTPDEDAYEQVVNCYYPESNSGYAAGKAIMKSDRAFYNGEVAYDLNNFYLYKRYSDMKVTAGDGKVRYRYYTIGEDNKPVLHDGYKYYESHPEFCSSGYVDKDYYGIAYVEDRFEDGDFVFADGTIPTEDDERHHIEEVTNPETSKTTHESHYYPIWPDDYLFFGQKLTYGYSQDTHQENPSAIVKSAGRLPQTEQSNRVYRAPAYYRDSIMSVAHFNPNAYLAQKSYDGTKEAYPGMTAIDFAGHYASYKSYGTYGLGNVNDRFYPPLLDDDGLQSIVNCNETQNLLVYAPAETAVNGYANKATYDVLTDYFVDPEYDEYYKNASSYRNVTVAPTTSIYGHLVMSNLTATNDHLLVDKEDFNCPIGYTFTGGKHMWYQRTPEDNEFVDHSKGWQGISLPFTAELVSASDKGEITHFYSGSETSKNSDSKIGHEYWLRRLESLTADDDKIKGNFNYPEADGTDKRYASTFLWDYYYQYANRKDKNDDTYQEYYRNAHTYKKYPLLAKATPYILGLPGQTYYEFDLSGNFTAQNTAATITKLGKQTITFVSSPNDTIHVSDKEMKEVTLTSDGNKYTFKPSYLNETIAAGSNAYTLNNNGNAYNKVAETGAATEVSAFRPYFTVTPSTSSSRPVTRSIVFANNNDELSTPHETHESQDNPGMLYVTSGQHKVIASSTMTHTVTLYIISAGGITLKTFDVKPGETVETRLNNSGVYIVESADGRYIKKLAVR